ncbi:MAG TPA: hemolysin family protein [Catenuloplanes sp.]
MQDYWIQLALVGVLVILNAAFAGSEMALVSLRESQLQRLERTGRAGRTLARLATDPNRYLATIQIGITLAGFLASAAAAVSLARPIVPLLKPLGGAAEPVAVVLVTLVLAFISLVFGELAPKRIAMQRAERWALTVARPLDLLASLSRPFVWALGATSDLVVRMAGVDPKASRDEIGPDELRDIVATNRAFTREQRTIIAGAVEIAERQLRAVLVPRLQVFSLDAGTPAEAARIVLASSGHSRAPVARHGMLDDVVGVVHLSDLVCVPDDRPVDECARPPLLLPDSLPVSDALRQFKAERQHIALVVDERGAIAGIVTLEDILEEIVGEIYDETDRDVQSVRRERDGALLLPGTFPIHDLTDIGVELEDRPGGEYTTVAGLVLALLGHIPTGPGESVTVGDWTAQVAAVKHHAITGVRLRRAAKDGEDGGDVGNGDVGNGDVGHRDVGNGDVGHSSAGGPSGQPGPDGRETAPRGNGHRDPGERAAVLAEEPA